MAIDIGRRIGTPSSSISIWKISDKPALPDDVSWSARLLGTHLSHPSSDESLEVITTLAPVETRLAENPPSPRPQISAERGKETLAGRRDLTAFIGEYDVPHGHKCIGNSDSDLASQVIVTTAGETECIVVC